MAAARVNLPTVFLYGGSILPGRVGDRALDIVSVFEAVGANAVRRAHRRGAEAHRAQRLPDRGLCAGMFTANTMASVAEAIGMALPGSSSPPAVDRRRDDFAYAVGGGRHRPARREHPAPPDHDQGGVRERDRRGDGARRLDQRRAAPDGDRQRGAGRARARRLQPGRPRVPHITDAKPHGRYHMVDIDRIGGIPVVLRALLEAGLLHGDCLTVTGQDDGREPRGARPAGSRRQRGPPDQPAHPRGRGHRRAHRVRSPRTGRW